MKDEQLRGVLIKANNWDGVFKTLVSTISFVSYNWWVKDIDAYLGTDLRINSSLNGHVLGTDLTKEIVDLEVIIFGKFVTFPRDYKGNVDIESYEEFQSSDAQIILLVVDGYYFEFYFKDTDLTNTVAEIARRKGFKRVELIAGENDGRTCMDVW
ncbi:DUF2691 family protein [Fodinisporobacter ferrooxydans]|uniref:DUF2691 family protein n=1 Tax=Fodinisporobacter ferrooxydans TaxID=2901836 RepID=A0ABY4CET9_9BACL|nr:DUF2691 family protein [Alicyclobacillaceae bacterium MYW30-H2]